MAKQKKELTLFQVKSGFCAPLDASGGPYPAEDTFVNELELGTHKEFN